ncbi:hypothetical protein Z517_09049 [Fonsecaea pedrosoi CBS 271.37]|uniref:DUF7924 domain-containing protein n=1 Tax=Fonsecaea pedrosoi CBS 271.37 TaxID=1442368 RepID=A0A0D2GD41_9EURO|nr:uncharacterized protein Z517_09049 [Fonsecaea pedrosoi CBS 271.37]KIW76605.1 hypothetical protein Z517_09049 [Fonsecaea pedrosoi CBS 271.37]
MHEEHVPLLFDPRIGLRLSRPKPDILYGYTWDAFTTNQQTQLMRMTHTDYTAKNLRLIYPFFVVDFTGDTSGDTTGSLGYDKPRSTVPPVDTTAFSMAKAGSEARLFVLWKKGSWKHYTQQIDGLVVYRPEH